MCGPLFLVEGLVIDVHLSPSLLRSHTCRLTSKDPRVKPRVVSWIILSMYPQNDVKDHQDKTLSLLHLTLIYPAHFEDVPCQSGVNHIFEG